MQGLPWPDPLRKHVGAPSNLPSGMETYRWLSLAKTIMWMGAVGGCWARFPLTGDLERSHCTKLKHSFIYSFINTVVFTGII